MPRRRTFASGILAFSLGPTCAAPRGGKFLTCPLPRHGFHKLKTRGHEPKRAGFPNTEASLRRLGGAHGYAGSRRFTSKSTLSLSLPRMGQAAIRRTPTFFTKPRCRASPFSSSHRGPLMTSIRP